VKIAVVGVGALGGVWAAKLAGAGHDVWGIDASPQTVAAIRQSGVIVEDRVSGATTATPIAITDDPSIVGMVDAVFIFVKHHQTRAAATAAVPMVDAGTSVCSLQNGWGNSDILASLYPAEQVVMGITYQSATVLSPGRVAHTATRPSVVGPYLPDGDPARATAIAAAMSASGMETTVPADITTEVWKKLILNCASLPTAALTRLRSANLGAPGPLVDDVLDAIVREAVAVAQARGLPVDLDERISYVHRLLRGGGQGKASMLQDVEAHRKTEIEAVNAAVVREADRLGVPVPVNRAMAALVGGLERSWGQE
jgi:2-dehydropantoate 2-reductase